MCPLLPSSRFFCFLLVERRPPLSVFPLSVPTLSLLPLSLLHLPLLSLPGFSLSSFSLWSLSNGNCLCYISLNPKPDPRGRVKSKQPIIEDEDEEDEEIENSESLRVRTRSKSQSNRGAVRSEEEEVYQPHTHTGSYAHLLHVGNFKCQGSPKLALVWDFAYLDPSSCYRSHLHCCIFILHKVVDASHSNPKFKAQVLSNGTYQLSEDSAGVINCTAGIMINNGMSLGNNKFGR